MLFTFVELFQPEREIGNQPIRQKYLVLRGVRLKMTMFIMNKSCQNSFHRITKMVIESKAINLVY